MKQWSTSRRGKHTNEYQYNDTNEYSCASFIDRGVLFSVYSGMYSYVSQLLGSLACPYCHSPREHLVTFSALGPTHGNINSRLEHLTRDHRGVRTRTAPLIDALESTLCLMISHVKKLWHTHSFNVSSVSWTL